MHAYIHTCNTHIKYMTAVYEAQHKLESSKQKFICVSTTFSIYLENPDNKSTKLNNAKEHTKT